MTVLVIVQLYILFRWMIQRNKIYYCTWITVLFIVEAHILFQWMTVLDYYGTFRAGFSILVMVM